MDAETKNILNIVGIEFNELNELDNLLIPRELFLSNTKYEQIKPKLPELKKIYSSSLMTCLQKDALKEQRWPLINLVRQLLSSYYIRMIPIRKSDGYTQTGIKKYKRYFQLKHFSKPTSNQPQQYQES